MIFFSALFMSEVIILHRQQNYLLDKYIKHGMSAPTVHRMCIFPPVFVWVCQEGNLQNQ